MTTEERLLALEQELGRVTRLLGAQGQAVPDESRARSFVLVDKIGKPCATLSVIHDMPWLVLLDENGKERATLGMGESGAGLALRDEKGKPRATLVMSEGGPSLALFDENEKVRANLGLNKDKPGRDCTCTTRIRNAQRWAPRQ